MGGSWQHLFVDYSAAARKPPPVVGSHVPIQDLYAFAGQVCSPAPPAPLPEFEPAAWCTRVSHAVAFAISAYDGALLAGGSPRGVAAAVRVVAAKEVWDGVESFTRGAAVSGSLFGECAGEQSPKG